MIASAAAAARPLAPARPVSVAAAVRPLVPVVVALVPATTTTDVVAADRATTVVQALGRGRIPPTASLAAPSRVVVQARVAAVRLSISSRDLVQQTSLATHSRDCVCPASPATRALAILKTRRLVAAAAPGVRSVRELGRRGPRRRSGAFPQASELSPARLQQRQSL